MSCLVLLIWISSSHVLDTNSLTVLSIDGSFFHSFNARFWWKVIYSGQIYLSVFIRENGLWFFFSPKSFTALIWLIWTLFLRMMWSKDRSTECVKGSPLRGTAYFIHSNKREGRKYGYRWWWLVRLEERDGCWNLVQMIVVTMC